jgi:hypothetical protein
MKDTMEMRQDLPFRLLDGDAHVLWAAATIAGASFHIAAVEVQDQDSEQIAVSAAGGRMLDALDQLDGGPDGPYETVQLPGPGDRKFVLAITPYCT